MTYYLSNNLSFLILDKYSIRQLFSLNFESVTKVKYITH